jgi:type I site-specific restriction endonuclease
MAATPEQHAREEIDRLLLAAGWAVQDMATVKMPTRAFSA